MMRPVAMKPMRKPMRKVGRGEERREMVKQMRAHRQMSLLVFFSSFTKIPTWERIRRMMETRMLKMKTSFKLELERARICPFVIADPAVVRICSETGFDFH